MRTKRTRRSRRTRRTWRTRKTTAPTRTAAKNTNRTNTANKKNKATFQQAQIQSSNDNCNPGLSGDLWKGGSVGYKGGVNRVKSLNT